jgi:hypothetical protein
MSVPTSAARNSPPRPVQIALALFAIGLLLGVVRVLLKDFSSRPTAAMIGSVVILIIGYAWIYGLYQSRNWLRWFTVVWVGGGLVLTPWAASKLNDWRQILMLWVQFATSLGTVVLLVVPAASRWYGRRRVS